MAAFSDFFVDARGREDDLYLLLGCNESSSTEQITKEYHIRAKQYHPDKLSDEKEKEIAEEEMFRKINRAYEMLSNSETRQMYDSWRSAGLSVTFDNWLSLQARFKPSMHFGYKKEQLSLEPLELDTPPQCSSHVEDFRRTPTTSSSLLQQFRAYKI